MGLSEREWVYSVLLLVVFQCVVLLKAGINTQGCMTHLAPIPRMMPLPYLTITAHYTIRFLPFRDRFRERSLGEPSRKLRSWLAVTLMRTLISFEETFADFQPEFQLTDVGGG
jgi:hypothetical protein